MLPDLSVAPKRELGQVICFSELNLGIFAAEQTGLLRSMNRSALLLALCALQLDLDLREELKRNAETFGIYCAVDHDMTCQSELRSFVEISDRDPGADLGSLWNQLISPKWALQSSVGLVAHDLSIILGAEGGVQSFLHSKAACGHALDQALLDLESGRVQYALVGAVMSAEDPLISAKYQSMASGGVVAEGAAVLLLSRDDNPASVRSGLDLMGSANEMREKAIGVPFFGIADPLIQSLRPRNQQK